MTRITILCASAAVAFALATACSSSQDEPQTVFTPEQLGTLNPASLGSHCGPDAGCPKDFGCYAYEQYDAGSPFYAGFCQKTPANRSAAATTACGTTPRPAP